MMHEVEVEDMEVVAHEQDANHGARLYEEVSDEDLAEIKAASKGGTMTSPERLNWLQKFKDIEPGKAFYLPIPDGSDPKTYRANVHNFFSNQGMKKRKVMIDKRKGMTARLVVEKLK